MTNYFIFSIGEFKIFIFNIQVVKEEAVPKVMVVLFAPRTVATAVSPLSRAVDKAALSGMSLQLHLAGIF